MENLQKIQPLWDKVGPFVSKRASNAAAERSAKYFNKRRRKRLGIPDPALAHCPPVDFTADDCPKQPKKIVWVPAIVTSLIGVGIGAAVGFFFGKK